MTRRWLVLAMVPFLPFLTHAAVAQAPAPSWRGTLSLEGTQVPLPEGVWEQAGTASTADGVVSLALLQLHDSSVTGAVLVQTNRSGTRPDWGDAPECERADLPLARTHYKSDHDGSCAFVIRAETGGAEVDAAWHAGQATAAARGWTLPAAWAVVGVRVTAPLAGVQVRYATLPEVTGGPGVAALVAWTPSAWEQVERGLHNQLDPVRPLPPLTSPGAAPAWALPPPVQGGWRLSRAVWKTISFRVIGTSIDFTTNLIAIGDLATAAALSSLPIIIGPWIYLGHELAWERFGTPAERHQALPGLGAEGPWPQPAAVPAGKTS